MERQETYTEKEYKKIIENQKVVMKCQISYEKGIRQGLIFGFIAMAIISIVIQFIGLSVEV